MKEKLFMVLDSETATLPFADEIADTPERKKKIAIAKPLIYNIGWTIANRKGEIKTKREFLISETFSVPAIFNTAYYKDKRPIYLEKLKRHEITLTDWNSMIEVLLADMRTVNGIGCFNSMFDMIKAIPFTECYIKHLYSDDYYKWENIQRGFCTRIVNGYEPKKNNSERGFDTFTLRGVTVPMFDIWGLACKYLLNREKYKNLCLDLNMVTNSGDFFKTSAESSYRYLCSQYDFNEEHTALADAEIETYILSKIASRRAIEMGIEFFPFRLLGTTTDFIVNGHKTKPERCQVVYDAMNKYLDGLKYDTPYSMGIRRKVTIIEEYI